MMLPRRAAFFGLALLTTAVLFWLLFEALAPGGWGVAKLALLLCFMPVALWFGVCVGNALPGFLLRFSPLFWLEAVAVVAFGVSWLTKGEAILADK